MTLAEKIRNLYPSLMNIPLFEQGILLQNDSDGRGDYIAEWNHAILAKPTQEQLDAIG